MIVLDAFAVIAFLRDEPAAAEVDLLLRRDEPCSLTAVGVAEIVDHLVRLVGADVDDAALDVAQLGLATPVVVDGDLALRAGALRARHHHRRRCVVSMADCVAAEAARVATALATADPHLLDLCHAEGIEVVAVPDSLGGRWSPAAP